MATETKAIVKAVQLDPRGKANQGEPRVPNMSEESLPPRRKCCHPTDRESSVGSLAAWLSR